MTGKINQMTSIGVMAAVLAILGPLAIPLGPVPLSLTNLAIFIAVYSLGMKRATGSYLIYLFIGFVGLPVFSGFSGGPGKLLGPTGGYLIGFIFVALVSGYFVDKYFDRWLPSVLGMCLGMVFCYLFGSLWLAKQAALSLKAALAVGVIPFIPGDLLKIFFAASLGPKLRKRLTQANLF